MVRLKVLAKNLNAFKHDQRGATLVLVALFLVVIMGFVALAVDAGEFYKARREMVTAADAAALAGAKALVEGKMEAEAKNDATDYAVYNKAQGSLIVPEVKTITYDGSPRKVIEVKVGRNEKWIFAKVFGFTDKNIMAGAVATWGYVKKVTGGDVLPVFIEVEEYSLDDPIPLHYGKLIDNEVDILGGNWGLLDVGSGKEAVKVAFSGDPVDKTFVSGDPPRAESEPGSADSIIKGIEKRMERCAGGEVTMYGLVPLIDQITGSGGKLDLRIIGFAVYLIEDVITDKPVKGAGSEWADFDPSTPPKVYLDGEGKPLYDKATIIGHFTGETVDVSVVVQPDDQTNPNPGGSPPTTYVKLIE